MAPTIAGVDWYWEDSTAPLVISKPAAFASGDILIAAFIQHNNPSFQTDLTTSADWNLEGNLDGTLVDGKIFSHVYDPGDPSTWSFTYRSTADVCMGVFRITDADQAPVVTVTSTATSSTTSPMDSPTLTPAGADDLLICLIADHGNGAAFSCTIPSGMTTQGQTQVSGLYMALAAASQALTSGAATGVRTWTSVSPTGTNGGTWSIAVKSPAGADPLDPLPAPVPPPWLMQQIAISQTQWRRESRVQDDSRNYQLATSNLPPVLPGGIVVITPRADPPPPGPDVPTRRDPANRCDPTRPGSAVVYRTPPITGPYVAAQYSSFQGDGGNDGSAVTTDGKPLPGDQLLVAVTDSQSATPPTAPAGWAEIPVSDTDQGSAFETHYYLLANPAASTTYTWTVVGGRRTITGILVRGGVYEVGDTLETATSTSHTSPTVTSIGTDRLAVAVLVNRSFPTCTWTENQAGSWDERVQTVGGDGVTNMQVSVQNRPVGPGAISDTFLCANGEPAIIGLFLFGAGPATRGAAVVAAGPLPKLAGTATVTGTRTDPSATQPDFPPRLILTLGTIRQPSGTAFVLPSFDPEDVAPPRQTTVTAVRPLLPAGSALVVAPHTDITPDTPCPEPVLSTGRPYPVAGSAIATGSRTDPTQDTPTPQPTIAAGRPGPALPGGVSLTEPRTDPTGAATNSYPVPVISTGRPPALAGASVLAGPRTDPTPDTPCPQPTVAAGRPGPVSASVALLAPRTDPTPATAVPQPTITAGRPIPQAAGSTALTAGRADPTSPDSPCPTAVITFRAVPSTPGSTVLTYLRTDATPDTLPPAVDQSTATLRPATAGQVLLTRTVVEEAPQPRPGIVTAGAARQPGAGAAMLRSTFTAPIVAGDSVRGPVIVAAGRRLIAAGVALFGRLTHSCTTPRPTTGTTTRPSTGTTAYNRATTSRPNTGTTARPNTGTTVDPC